MRPLLGGLDIIGEKMPYSECIARGQVKRRQVGVADKALVDFLRNDKREWGKSSVTNKIIQTKKARQK